MAENACSPFTSARFEACSDCAWKACSRYFTGSGLNLQTEGGLLLAVRCLLAEASRKAACFNQSWLPAGCRASLATEVQQPLDYSDQRCLHSRPEDQGEASTSAPTQGRLQLIVGPMFAGKTTRLIAEIHALAVRPASCLTAY